MKKTSYECDICNEILDINHCFSIEIRIIDHSEEYPGISALNKNIHLCTNCSSDFGINKENREINALCSKIEIQQISVENKNILKIIKNWIQKCKQV